MDPRIAERRIEVKRAQGRRRLLALMAAASLVVAAGLAFLAVNSPFLDVDRVLVTGAHHVTTDQVRTSARVHRHDALLFVDTAAVARRLEALPWVRHASARREFPGTVRITIAEYTPVAYVRDGKGVVLLADTGRAITRVATPPSGTVEILGVRRAPKAGELLSPPEAASIVMHLPRALAQQVRALDVGGSGLALDLAVWRSARHRGRLDAKGIRGARESSRRTAARASVHRRVDAGHARTPHLIASAAG